MDPWTAILTKAGDYGPWGLVIAALAMALVWATLRNAKLQDQRVDDAKPNIKALGDNAYATEKLTAAVAAMTEAVRGMQAAQSAFIQVLAERDRDSRQSQRERGAR